MDIIYLEEEQRMWFVFKYLKYVHLYLHREREIMNKLQTRTVHEVKSKKSKDKMKDTKDKKWEDER